MSWYRDAPVRRFILFRYVPWLAGLSLAWETAHLPLYTVWTEASRSSMAFAVVHCTVGDVLIGAACLVLTLIVVRPGPLARWEWRRVACGTVLLAVGYTAFSEWLNVALLESWAYSERMPVIALGGFRLGASPVLQWLVIPPLALYLARHRRDEALYRRT